MDPVTVFVITATITYFNGSSWGAQALMMPLALPLAVTSGAAIPLTAAAVISGGSYGDVTSPVSGMTNMAAHVTRADRSQYVRQAFKWNTGAALLAAVGFLAAAWML